MGRFLELFLGKPRAGRIDNRRLGRIGAVNLVAKNDRAAADADGFGKARGGARCFEAALSNPGQCSSGVVSHIGEPCESTVLRRGPLPGERERE
jgi:hypothetical protein